MTIEAMLPPTGFVLSAAMCWGLHANGIRVFGNAGLGLCLVGLWTLAALNGTPTVDHARSTVKPRPSTLHAAELSVNRPASSVDGLVALSTLDKERQVYHAIGAGCHHERKIVAHRRECSEEEAIAAGYVPCSICLSRGVLTARSGQP